MMSFEGGVASPHLEPRQHGDDHEQHEQQDVDHSGWHDLVQQLLVRVVVTVVGLCSGCRCNMLRCYGIG